MVLMAPQDADGNVIRFSLNTLDRDVMRLPPSQVSPSSLSLSCLSSASLPLPVRPYVFLNSLPQVLRFYKAWQQLCAIVADPSNEAWLKLMVRSLPLPCA